jgi:hypothetical protein
MNEQTANAGGPSAGSQQVPAGGPEAGVERASGSSNAGERSQPDQAGQPKGKPGPDTAGGERPPNGGLAAVFQGGPEAGAERASGSSNTGERSQPDQAGQPKGNPRPEQSNDSLTLPVWAQQLPKKLTADSNSAARLSKFKNLDEFVQAYLDVSAQAGNAATLPGKDSTPQEVQAFYESLGKPKEAQGYSFAKNNPDFARVAFESNLSESQASAIFTEGLTQLDDARKGIQAALAQDFQATDVLLQKEYGENYGEAIALMQRGMGNNPKTGELSPVGLALVNAGLAGKPEIVRAFIELGRATSEDTAAGGRAGTSRPQSVLEGRGFEYKDSYN